MVRIGRREQFSDTTFLWEVDAADVARAAQPGQFVMLRLGDDGERIPLTIADFDRQRGTITLVIQALGKTTRDMLEHYGEGDEFADFAGPLGLPAHADQVGHVALVGGGLGVAPVYPQLRAQKAAGNRTSSIVGFRSADKVFWQERFARHSDTLTVCTDDGSLGLRGFVTEALRALCEGPDRPDKVIAIGPLAMMRACAEVTRPFGIPTVVSLNAIMVDGTGMCGSCRVSLGGEVKFACVDGPDFDAHLVDFDELLKRQRRFGAEEARASADYAHVCHLEQELLQEEKRNYKKLKELAPKATPMPERNADERSKNFLEVNLGYSMDQALAEAERCIQCSRPTCIAGCPVAIDIPRFIRHLLVRDLAGALEVIHENNLFPSICGRVCPQESQCEAQCIVGKKLEPVAIGRLERFVGDNAAAPKALPVHPTRSLGKVALVGSGPAGLACAADLAKMGIEATVFEALHVVGGVLRYGIPSFRLPRPIIDREIQRLHDMGVRIVTNKVVGKTFTVQELQGELGFDAVFLGVGAGMPAFLGIPGEGAGQVFSANEFLTRVNLMGGDRFPYRDTPVGMGKQVAVVGAGNTAMDCLRVARRLGAEVHCLYRRTEAEAPARHEELRHAVEEGVQFHWLHSPTEILLDPAGNVRGVVCQQMAMGAPDASGRRKPEAIPGAFTTFEVDTVVVALGTKANPIIPQSAPALQLNKWGNVVADAETQATSMPGVFAGGDIVTGGATVILAMGAGRRAAKSIAWYLHNRSWPPPRDEVAAFVPGGVPLCPRCRRPLEDDDDGICCAGLRLRWACERCHAVSEGAVLPWGQCPACGGALRLDDGGAASDQGEQAAVLQALAIELGGAAFYRGMAEQSTDAELRDLLGRLAAMEAEHLATLAQRYHVDAAQPADVTASQAALFAEVPLPSPLDAVGVLQLALGLERKAERYFLESAAALAVGAAARRLYQELAAEEAEHGALLETELRRRTQGKPGLL
ncbi:MAG: NADPH-dependent glutamate synthase [Deltaproteobacteria bacterium]|nr:NADPH-dependent glutamate synthase [Deltaproteobacteria bacterium]